MKRIAIQGIKGSNHHLVALNYYQKEPFELVECLSFDKMVANLMAQNSDKAIMAIENTIAGSIIPNYALIDKNNLFITGEYYLQIHHHLLALPGQKTEDLTEIWSHPMALLQCKEFFKNYENIRLIEGFDTASEAKKVSEKKLHGVGAIASKVASDIYNLDILEDEIQTIKNNATRFVIVEREQPEQDTENINKASLKFELDHKRGSLATVLNVISDCKLSLTKIQSLPKIETPWKYAFFVDVTFSQYEEYAKAKLILNIMAEEFKVLGEYRNNRL